MVKKANGKWRMYVDFTDLNKACPKDSYPLSRIDQLVDSTTGHQLLSFIDAFSRYNQIKMDETDQEKTSFITSQALIKEEEKVQKPVYYTSRALRGVEGRYLLIEKLAFTLITASRKLRHYFQVHVINVMMDHPLKKAMNKLEAAGRLIQWAVELSESGI
nr:uncharacterized protein LOC112030851 [Quercus suber]